MIPEHSNALIDETSPYLLQHAHNPVNWEPWGLEALIRAEKENRLLLVSIGYAACHWCHVMEHECFEDVEVARVMNENFVNIKVDREERPDVDHIYMDALQMMTGSGGWPLNIVALPDGRPFWGATFVKKPQWMQVLAQLSDLYRNDPEKIEGCARNMAEGLKSVNLIENNDASGGVDLDQIDRAVENWSQLFDKDMGGLNRAPKFPMPVHQNFLLHYATSRKNEGVMNYVNTTLTRMAWGGIFDHVGGGFSRYSVDTKWHVPHFEKMLYDNGQLVSVYAQAYAVTGNNLYRRTVDSTIKFVQEELMSENFGFYSSLDADSLTAEGQLEEGAFYVWTEDELKSLLGSRFDLFKEVFNINEYGHWEHGNYVLIRNASESDLAERRGISIEKLRLDIDKSLEILKTERAKRNRPRLDDKILTSWNGLMLKGLVDAYRFLEDGSYLDLALKNADFILKNLFKEDGGLFHNHKNGKSTINGYLEDYASVIDAFIGLYEATFDETWLQHARDLTEYGKTNFYDEASRLFFFTSKRDDYVIRRTIETADNVVPASNSTMAKNLFRLCGLFPDANYENLAVRMLGNLQENLLKNIHGHASWSQLALWFALPFYEVAIVGDEFQEKAAELRSRFLPNIILAGTRKMGSLSILQGRYEQERTLFYVCRQGACGLPTTQIKEVLAEVTSEPAD